MLCAGYPGLKPWAIICRPYGAGTYCGLTFWRVPARINNAEVIHVGLHFSGSRRCRSFDATPVAFHSRSGIAAVLWGLRITPATLVSGGAARRFGCVSEQVYL